MSAADPVRSAAQLRTGRLRQIGFLPLLAVFYAFSASGPFGYEEIFKVSGPGMSLLFLSIVPFFWCIPISLSAAELNGILPVEGGFYRWSRAAFGDFWGFQCGWWNWTGTFLLNSAYGVLLMDYVGDYVPGMSHFWRWAGASAMLCLLSYLNARGIQVAGRIAIVLQVVILVPVVWMCAVALFHLHFNPVLPFTPPGQPFGRSFGKGLALAMWDYAGYEQLSSVTGEMKDAQRNFVRVLAWTIPLTILTFTIPAALVLGVLGNWHDWQTGYIVTGARLVGGPALGGAMLLASIVSTVSLSFSTILYTTRIPATMAEDGYLPRWLAEIHPRWGTPARAIFVSTIVYCALATTSVVDLVNVYIWTRIATSLLTVLSAWRMRRKLPGAPRRFRIPGGAFGIACVVVLPAILCGIKVWNSEDYVFRYAPLLLAFGPVAYFVLRKAFGFRPAKPAA